MQKLTKLEAANCDHQDVNKEPKIRRSFSEVSLGDEVVINLHHQCRNPSISCENQKFLVRDGTKETESLSIQRHKIVRLTESLHWVYFRKDVESKKDGMSCTHT